MCEFRPDLKKKIGGGKAKNYWMGCTITKKHLFWPRGRHHPKFGPFLFLRPKNVMVCT